MKKYIPTIQQQQRKNNNKKYINNVALAHYTNVWCGFLAEQRILSRPHKINFIEPYTSIRHQENTNYNDIHIHRAVCSGHSIIDQDEYLF